MVVRDEEVWPWTSVFSDVSLSAAFNDWKLLLVIFNLRSGWRNHRKRTPLWQEVEARSVLCGFTYYFNSVVSFVGFKGTAVNFSYLLLFPFFLYFFLSLLPFIFPPVLSVSKAGDESAWRPWWGKPRFTLGLTAGNLSHTFSPVISWFRGEFSSC